MKKQVVLLVLCTLSLFLIKTANSITYTFQEGDGNLYSSMDGSRIDSYPAFRGNNNGASQDIYVGYYASDNIYYGLIKFGNIFGSNTGQVAYGTSITSAILSLRTISVWPTGSKLVNIYRIKTNWNEGTVTYNNFNNAYDPTLITSLNPSVDNTVYSIDITSLVQGWSNQAYLEGNQGIMLSTTNWGYVTFYSDNATNTSYRPMLTIATPEATIPEPMSIFLLLLGFLGLVRKKQSGK